MMDIFIFNVELGQCVFFYPRNHHDYAMMVDCGNTQQFNPVDFLIAKNFLSHNSSVGKHILSNLTLTNYDHDHFSGLPYLRSKVKISSVKFPKNLTSVEVKKIKPEVTDALTHVTDIMDTYTADVTDYNPPFTKHCFYLEKSDFPDTAVNTNKLSQLVFITYNGTRICLPGDLTSPAWEKHLLNKNVQTLLAGTDILIAPHHGREDGYNEKIFDFCKPECIILSDTYIKHDTQQGMTQLYASKINGNGVSFNGNSQNLRKTLTTRSDGHIWIRIEDNQSRIYRSFTV